MCKYNYILLIWLVIVNTVIIGCTSTQIAGGGASETVAIVINNTTISGIIKSDQSVFSHEVILYASDYVPPLQSSGGKWSSTLSTEGSFEYNLDSGMYNLIVIDTSNGNSAIIQNITVMNGIKEFQERKLVPSGSVEISLKEISPEMIYIPGTPFYTYKIENNSAKIEGVPAGSYKMVFILSKSGEAASPDSSTHFIIKSNETSFISIQNKIISQ